MNYGFRLHFYDKTVFVSQSTLEAKCDGNKKTYATTVEGCNVLWQFVEENEYTAIKLSIKSDSPLNLKRIDSLVFNIGTPGKTDKLASFTNASVRSQIRFPWELGVDREYFGDCFAHFADFESKGTAIAFLSPFSNPIGAGAKALSDGTIEFFAKTEYTEAKSKELELETETLLLFTSATINEIYTVYRSLLPQSTFDMPKLVGWNTWDYYLTRVTPEDIEENVNALKNMSFADKLDYIVIDDGWQKQWGDWRENEKFACGIKHVADVIKNAGFIPGIWMAPLFIQKDSSVLVDHPDWFCRNEDGSLAEEYGRFCLDPTVPEARKFILDNFRYQYDAGYRLFKIDYLSKLISVKKFYDPTKTAYPILRELMADIKAIGDDVIILGCSLPVQCGADIAPAMRIGVDIHNHFTHVHWIAESLAWTWMYNNKVTRIDPDFLVVRGEETADEELIWEGNGRNSFLPPIANKMTDGELFQSRWRHGDQFTAIEAETWANLVAVCGGNIFLSDKMSVLNEKGIKIIENAFKIEGNFGYPRFLKEDTRNASVWENEKGILVVNWENIPRTMTVDCDFEVTSSIKEFAYKDGKLTVTLLPHESFFGFKK
ncbi:MAG: alpha-galactosidase [Clostridia bacterium]|nr:alpha-galactosidase [Clostridia bacterium]